MKKILMGSVALLCFAISLLIVQVSCSKTEAKPLDAPQLNKIIFFRDIGGGALTRQIWIANYDGSDATQVPLILPSNVSLDNNAATLSLSVSPDGETIFFTGVETNGSVSSLNIYSCDIAGNNLKIAIAGASTTGSHHPVAF